MNINATIVAAGVGMLGVMVGATLQYFYGKRAEASKLLQSQKNQAYVDFVKSTAGITIAQRRQNKEKVMEFTVLLADARARIAIYGNKEVIKAIADFFREYETLQSPEAMSAFTKIAQKMRGHAVSKGESVTEKELSMILFSTD